ncbi:MAG TPA: DUF4339 domain-containing protein [Chlamydiales bacterium]|nr:DUF4339 domain-containing protein [Chlamydiales bacterium]
MQLGKYFLIRYNVIKKMPIPFTSLTLIAAALTGVLGAYLAHRRGRNPYVWFFVGFFFGILGAFAIFFAPSGRKNLLKEKPKVAIQQPRPTIRGPADKFWYYLDLEHQQIGPMSLSALTTAWHQEKISLTTYVWHEELPEWKPLQELIPCIKKTENLLQS